MSNPKWPEFSAHKGGTEQQGHKDGQDGPELPNARHLSAAFPVVVRNIAPKHGCLWDSGPLQAQHRFTAETPLGKGKH